MRTLSDNQVEVLKQIAKEYLDEAQIAREWMNTVKTQPSIDAHMKAQDKYIVAQRFMFNLGLEIK